MGLMVILLDSQYKYQSLSFLRIPQPLFLVNPRIQHFGLTTAHVQLEVVAVLQYCLFLFS